LLSFFLISIRPHPPSTLFPYTTLFRSPAELRARIATYAGLASAGDKKNLPFLRSALRSERDPLLRIVLADAVYRSDPDQGGGVLLEAMPPSAELFLRLRSVGRELALPVPAVSSLLDLAVDGSAEALARLFALAPPPEGVVHAAPPQAPAPAAQPSAPPSPSGPPAAGPAPVPAVAPVPAPTPAVAPTKADAGAHPSSASRTGPAVLVTPATDAK